jgi:diphthamide biosynthesis protein 7
MNTRRALVLSLDLSSRKPGLAEAQEQHGDAKLLISQSDGSLAYLPSLSAAFEDDGSAGRQAEETPRADSRVAAAAESDDEDDDADEETLAAHAALNAAFAGRPRGLETWAAHGHEAWIAAWDCWSDGTVGWSGALPDLTPSTAPRLRC